MSNDASPSRKGCRPLRPMGYIGCMMPRASTDNPFARPETADDLYGTALLSRCRSHPAADVYLASEDCKPSLLAVPARSMRRDWFAESDGPPHDGHVESIMPGAKMMAINTTMMATTMPMLLTMMTEPATGSLAEDGVVQSCCRRGQQRCSHRAETGEISVLQSESRFFCERITAFRQLTPVATWSEGRPHAFYEATGEPTGAGCRAP